MNVFRKCFLVLMRWIIQQLRCLQFNTYTTKLQKQAYGLIFFKRGWKEDFNIGMQMYADECISLTCFYWLSNVFPMFRQKEVKSVKLDHQWLPEN